MKHTLALVLLVFIAVTACTSKTYEQNTAPPAAAPGQENPVSPPAPAAAAPPQPPQNGAAAIPGGSPNESSDPSSGTAQLSIRGEAAVREFIICQDVQERSFAQANGYICVDSCPDGYDVSAAKIGQVCTPHYTGDTVMQWPVCKTSADCSSQTRCGFAAYSTSGEKLSWATDAEGYRCLPNTYVLYLFNKGNLTLT